MPIATFDVDYDEAVRLLAPYSAPLHQLVASAIATERERCAQIAEGFNAAGKPIAAMIRSDPARK